MIVAVTGGSGFIGGRLVERLAARGDSVRVLTRHPERLAGLVQVEPVGGDLLAAGAGDLAAFLQGVEVLYHCAGQLKDERAMRPLHVDATRKLIEAAAGRIGRWVQLSSVGVYGPKVQGIVTEESPLAPIGEYETTKTEADLLVLEAFTRGGFDCTLLRPSNVYGAGMRNRSLYGLISMIDRGWFFFIGQPGATANYIHVDNVVEALLRCGTMVQAGGRTYNLSDQRTLEEFVAIVAATLGRSVPSVRLQEWPVRMAAGLLGFLPGSPLTGSRVKALTGRAVYASDRIERELGYHHVRSMEEGVVELTESWLRERG